MDKVVAYLLEKETITGGEMVAIIEGRDPALVEDAYASTRVKPLPGEIEPPAKNIHIVSQPVSSPAPEDRDHPEMPTADAGLDTPEGTRQPDGEGGEENRD